MTVLEIIDDYYRKEGALESALIEEYFEVPQIDQIDQLEPSPEQARAKRIKRLAAEKAERRLARNTSYPMAGLIITTLGEKRLARLYTLPRKNSRYPTYGELLEALHSNLALVINHKTEDEGSQTKQVLTWTCEVINNREPLRQLGVMQLEIKAYHLSTAFKDLLEQTVLYLSGNHGTLTH